MSSGHLGHAEQKERHKARVLVCGVSRSDGGGGGMIWCVYIRACSQCCFGAGDDTPTFDLRVERRHTYHISSVDGSSCVREIRLCVFPYVNTSTLDIRCMHTDACSDRAHTRLTLLYVAYVLRTLCMLLRMHLRWQAQALLRMHLRWKAQALLREGLACCCVCTCVWQAHTLLATAPEAGLFPEQGFPAWLCT